MKNVYKQKRQQGFTIIEVLIVLAIAGLIMLIVFLAVPALQRNSRNSARNSDAARVAAAVTECLANRNGVIDSCNEDDEIQQGNMSELINFGVVTADNFSQNTANVYFQRECEDTGDKSKGSTSARAFVVLFQLEPDVNRCVGA